MRTAPELLVDHAGRVMYVHNRRQCRGACALHRPSNHRMRGWPVMLRETGLLERFCPHGVGHPDPDSVAHFKRRGVDGFGVHGCDGCCAKEVG